jgi:hypothetical protein
MFPGTIPAYTVSPSPDGDAFDVEIATSASPLCRSAAHWVSTPRLRRRQWTLTVAS